METAARLFVLDSVMVDVTVRVARLPARGSDTRASTSLVATGGGFNVASAAARHGLAAVYAGRPGRGPLSEVAAASLRTERVDAPVEPDAEHDAGFCLVLVDDQGERTFVTVTGAELTLRRADLDALALRAGDFLYVSGYNLVYPEIGATVADWLATVRDDVTVAVDPGARVGEIPAGLLDAALSRCDWLLCNETEAAQLAAGATPEQLCGALNARAGVVVHDGAAGCVVAASGVPATRVSGLSVDVVDTNGAGDAHNGVFLAELARGRDPVSAAWRANGAAALAIGRLGPATAPTRDELSAWFRVLGESA